MPAPCRLPPDLPQLLSNLHAHLPSSPPLKQKRHNPRKGHALFLPEIRDQRSEISGSLSVIRKHSETCCCYSTKSILHQIQIIICKSSTDNLMKEIRSS